ncbi:MAG: DNA polymerase III subunit gamma/tau [Candidatus Eisenbacteria bacterium]|nr:DNA polymerase III subunit gamma/tau [Candidatus Eisenbacteria bacterium]
MSYLVLARKWRPETFSQVVGQRHVVTTLSAAVRTDRIGHAYLFTGPRGVGKTTIARVLAKALNCEKGPTDEPCLACDSCREIASGKSLDVIEIDGASNRKIEDARGIRETVQYAPLSGRKKVYIIDEAHMLTREAFNALLKTIEEPPPHVVFVLATTEPSKIPDTITSRCQRFDFHRVSAADMEARLRHIAQAEGVRVSDGAVRLLAARADGSMRDAESLFDQLLATGSGDVGADDVAAILGIPRVEVFRSLSDAIAARDTRAALGAFTSALDAGFDPRDLIDGLVEHLRDLLVRTATGEPGAPDVGDGPETPARALTEDQLVRLLRIAAETQAQARWTTQPSLMVELALARMARLPRTVEIEEIVRALAAASGGSGHAGGATPPGGTPASGDAGAGSAGPSQGRGGTAAAAGRPAARGEQWALVVERVKARKPALGAFLTEAVASPLTDGRLGVLIPNGSNFHRQQLQDRANMTLLEQAAGDVYGKPVKLSLTFAEAARAVPAPAAAPQRREAGDGEDPMVRKVLEMFDGEITDTRAEE